MTTKASNIDVTETVAIKNQAVSFIVAQTMNKLPSYIVSQTMASTTSDNVTVLVNHRENWENSMAWIPQGLTVNVALPAHLESCDALDWIASKLNLNKGYI